MKDSHSVDIQKFFLEILIQDSELFVRVQNIYNSENFHKSLLKPARFITNYVTEYGTLPEIQQVNVETGSKLQLLTFNTDQHKEWFLNEFEKFTKYKEFERAIIEGSELLDEGEMIGIESLIKNAAQISLTRDLGINYWQDPKERLMRLKSNNGQISTGWESLDHKLYGGVNKGELVLFSGTAGSGKSLFMQNLAVNWITAGLNVIFITLELSEELTCMRMDGMISGTPSKEIFKNMDDVTMKIGLAQKKSGNLQVKYFPAQSNINDFRSFIKEWQIQHSLIPDVVIVDYLDLCYPTSVKVGPSDVFIKDKYVCEELRNLASELGVVLISASQLNRSANEEIEYDFSMIAGGLSKFMTADNFFGIYTSRAMRENGKYQLQLMKTRSSGGVGSKIDLDFNNETLRITDPGIDAQDNSQTNTALMDKIKRNVNHGIVETDTDSSVPIKVDASASTFDLREKLKELKMNQSDDF